MRCKDCETWMIESLDADGERPGAESVRDHIAACSTCHETWRLLQVSDFLLTRHRDVSELDSYFYTRLNARIRLEHQEKDMMWTALWGFTRKLLAVSTVMLLLLVGSLIYQLTWVTPEAPVVVNSDMEPHFPDGPGANLVLQHGNPQNDQILEAVLGSGGRRRP